MVVACGTPIAPSSGQIKPQLHLCFNVQAVKVFLKQYTYHDTCICALKKIVHDSVVPADGAHTKVEFLNACIKRFGEKDVMNEIKK